MKPDMPSQGEAPAEQPSPKYPSAVRAAAASKAYEYFGSEYPVGGQFKVACPRRHLHKAEDSVTTVQVDRDGEYTCTCTDKSCGDVTPFLVAHVKERGYLANGTHLFQEYHTNQPNNGQPSKLRPEGKNGSPPRVDVFGAAEPIGMEALTADPTSPPVLLPGIIPVNVFGMVGPGGSSKTTMMIYIMIHIILEKEIWGRMPERTGPCVFVSAEDDKATMVYRVHRICKGLELTDEEMQRVASMLYVHDVSGDIVRFVEADVRGNLAQTTYVDELINMYADKGVAITCFDPAVFFGAGERFVNDAEATLMQVGRRVSNKLDCAVGFIHHTGKGVARDKVVDQYAGRGGSAFADNSRALLVLHTLEKGGDAPAAVPEEVTQKDIEQFRVAYLTVAKFSAGPRPELPFWWIRSEHDGFEFQTLEGLYLSPDERDRAKIIADKDKRLSLITAIYNSVVHAINFGKYPTKTYLREMADIIVANKKMGKNRISTGVEYCLVQGFLEEAELPEEEKQGARKHYLKPVKRPCLQPGKNPGFEDCEGDIYSPPQQLGE